MALPECQSIRNTLQNLVLSNPILKSHSETETECVLVRRSLELLLVRVISAAEQLLITDRCLSRLTLSTRVKGNCMPFNKLDDFVLLVQSVNNNFIFFQGSKSDRVRIH